jgi:hypothetical protein
MTDSVTVTDVEAPLGLQLPDDGDVVLFPDDLDGERGFYPIAATAVVDELAESGIGFRTLHDGADVEWYGDRGDPVLLTIILGIVSSAAWDGIKRLLAKRKQAPVDLTIGYRRDGTVRWVRAAGNAEDVATAMATLR